MRIWFSRTLSHLSSTRTREQSDPRTANVADSPALAEPGTNWKFTIYSHRTFTGEGQTFTPHNHNTSIIAFHAVNIIRPSHLDSPYILRHSEAYHVSIWRRVVFSESANGHYWKTVLYQVCFCLPGIRREPRRGPGRISRRPCRRDWRSKSYFRGPPLCICGKFPSGARPGHTPDSEIWNSEAATLTSLFAKSWSPWLPIFLSGNFLGRKGNPLKFRESWLSSWSSSSSAAADNSDNNNNKIQWHPFRCSFSTQKPPITVSGDSDRTVAIMTNPMAGIELFAWLQFDDFSTDVKLGQRPTPQHLLCNLCLTVAVPTSGGLDPSGGVRGQV